MDDATPAPTVEATPMQEAAIAYARAKMDLDSMMTKPFDRDAYEAVVGAWRAALAAVEAEALKLARASGALQ